MHAFGYPGFHRIFFSYRYQTVSMVYFILGILTDLWSQGSLCLHVIRKVRYRDLLNGGMNELAIQ